MDAYVYVGAQAPEDLVIQIPADGSADLTRVSAIDLSVLKPGLKDISEEVTWSVNILTQTSLKIIIQHVYAAADINQPGTYRVMVNMTIPGEGVVRAGPLYILGLY